MTKLHEINTAIDNFTLDYLTLLQKNIEENAVLEKSMQQGNFHLAKARYIMGHCNVSALQLPNQSSNEEAPDIEPIVTVTKNDDEQFELNIRDVSSVKEATEEKVVDPINWFGVLVPQDLRYAQTQFQKTCRAVIERANIKEQINDLSEKLLLLFHAKEEIKQKGADIKKLDQKNESKLQEDDKQEDVDLEE